MRSKDIAKQIRREEKTIRYFNKEFKRKRITKKVHDQCVRGLLSLLKQLRQQLLMALSQERQNKLSRKRKLVV